MQLIHFLPFILGVTVSAIPGVIAGSSNNDLRTLSVKPSCMDKAHPPASCLQQWENHLWCVANPKPCAGKKPWLSKHLKAPKPDFGQAHGHAAAHGNHHGFPAVHGKPKSTKSAPPPPPPPPSSAAPPAASNSAVNNPSEGVTYNGASYDAGRSTGALYGALMNTKRDVGPEDDAIDEDDSDQDINLASSSLQRRSKLVAQSNHPHLQSLAICLAKRPLKPKCALAWLRTYYCIHEQTTCQKKKPRQYKALFGDKAPKPDLVRADQWSVEKLLEKGPLYALPALKQVANNHPYPDNYGFKEITDLWQPIHPIGVGVGPVVHPSGQTAAHPIFPRGEALDEEPYVSESDDSEEDDSEEDEFEEDETEMSPAALSKRAEENKQHRLAARDAVNSMQKPLPIQPICFTAYANSAAIPGFCQDIMDRRQKCHDEKHWCKKSHPWLFHAMFPEHSD